jgi:recombination protein RecR
MEGIGPDQLKIGQLLERIQKEGIKEVILATSSTVAGEATSAFLAESLKNCGVQVTRIACGIPMGMDLKYADQMTLQKALEARTSF